MTKRETEDWLCCIIVTLAWPVAALMVVGLPIFAALRFIMNKFKKVYSSIAHMMKGKPTPRRQRRNEPEPTPEVRPEPATIREGGVVYYTVPATGTYTIDAYALQNFYRHLDVHQSFWTDSIIFKTERIKKRTITNRLKGLG